MFDPTNAPGYLIPRGKQVVQQSHIWYTPCSGIWQSVWLESVPANHITELDIVAGMDGNGEFYPPYYIPDYSSSKGKEQKIC